MLSEACFNLIKKINIEGCNFMISLRPIFVNNQFKEVYAKRLV